ncbi:MAG: M48 family metalloprotease [Planctomycetaceae bacterium]|nr:M48 family metalloprotease [Planctomycetaceae bacterium]
MNALGATTASLLVHALGWALVHSLWQGAVIVLAAAAALRLISPTRPRLRYAVACTALLMMVLLAGATALVCAGQLRSAREPSPAHRTAEAQGSAMPADAAAPAAGLLQALLDVNGRLRPALPWLVAAWLVGVMTAGARRAWAWRYARGLVRHDVWPVGESLAHAAAAMARRLGVGRAVAVLQSARVAVPVVIGWLRPVVLLPLSAVTALTPAQLEAILAHELAHIARHDYLINLLQAAAETLLFYHPAAWWLSRRIRQQREYCCDDIAARATGAAAVARALTATARLALPHRSVTAAVAADGGGTFFHRIRRLVAPEVRPGVGALDLLALALLAAIALSGAAYASYTPSSLALPNPVAALERTVAPPVQDPAPVLPAAPAAQQFVRHALPAPKLAPRPAPLPGQPAPAPMQVKAGDQFTYRQNGSLTGPQVKVRVISVAGRQATLDVEYNQPGASRRQTMTVDQSAIPSVVATAGQGTLSTVGPAASLAPSVSTRNYAPVQWTAGATGVTMKDHLTNQGLTVTPRPGGAPEISVHPGLANPAGTRWVPSP